MWGWPVCLIQKAMTAPRPVATGLRALGWDVRTGYSTSRGERLSDRAFGHGGFTGTVLWIDPGLDLFFVFLSNRVHPDGKGFARLYARSRSEITAHGASVGCIVYTRLSRAEAIMKRPDTLADSSASNFVSAPPA